MGTGCRRWLCAAVSLCLALSVAACSRTAKTTSGAFGEPSSTVGVASWYGPGFNGKHTASGEIYDQEELTAASPTIALGRRVLVTNLKNGRSVEVRINDRGPFVKGRKIDLSHRAAMILGMTDHGTERVRINVLRGLGLEQKTAGYFVQVGSFSNSAYANKLGERLRRLYSDVSVDQLNAGRRSFYRVRMGSFPDHGAAMARATQTAQMGLSVIIIRQ